MLLAVGWDEMAAFCAVTLARMPMVMANVSSWPGPTMQASAHAFRGKHRTAGMNGAKQRMTANPARSRVAG